MPLGTANDFGHILGWGQKYPGDGRRGESAMLCLQAWVESVISPRSQVVNFDVFGIMPEAGKEHCDFKLCELTGRKGRDPRVQLDGRSQMLMTEAALPVPFLVCLYFSAGFGAEVVSRFQLNRKDRPWKNRLEYVKQGAGIVTQARPPQLGNRMEGVSVRCEGQEYFPPRKGGSEGHGERYREVGFYNINWQANMIHGADRAPACTRLCGTREPVTFNDGCVDMYRMRFRSFLKNPGTKFQTDKRRDMTLRHVGRPGQGVFFQWDGEARFAFSPSGEAFSIHVRKVLNIRVIPVVLGHGFDPKITGDPDNGRPASFAFCGDSPLERQRVRQRMLENVRGELDAALNATKGEMKAAGLPCAGDAGARGTRAAAGCPPSRSLRVDPAVYRLISAWIRACSVQVLALQSALLGALGPAADALGPKRNGKGSKDKDNDTGPPATTAQSKTALADALALIQKAAEGKCEFPDASLGASGIDFVVQLRAGQQGSADHMHVDTAVPDLEIDDDLAERVGSILDGMGRPPRGGSAYAAAPGLPALSGPPRGPAEKVPTTTAAELSAAALSEHDSKYDDIARGTVSTRFRLRDRRKQESACQIRSHADNVGKEHRRRAAAWRARAVQRSPDKAHTLSTASEKLTYKRQSRLKDAIARIQSRNDVCGDQLKPPRRPSFADLVTICSQRSSVVSFEPSSFQEQVGDHEEADDESSDDEDQDQIDSRDARLKLYGEVMKQLVRKKRREYKAKQLRQQQREAFEEMPAEERDAITEVCKLYEDKGRILVRDVPQALAELGLRGNKSSERFSVDNAVRHLSAALITDNSSRPSAAVKPEMTMVPAEHDASDPRCTLHANVANPLWPVQDRPAAASPARSAGSLSPAPPAERHQRRSSSFWKDEGSKGIFVEDFCAVVVPAAHAELHSERADAHFQEFMKVVTDDENMTITLDVFREMVKKRDFDPDCLEAALKSVVDRAEARAEE
ncbi:unnamed protein product, partial [Prorocentrum cordatum]